MREREGSFKDKKKIPGELVDFFRRRRQKREREKSNRHLDKLFGERRTKEDKCKFFEQFIRQ